MERRRNEPLSQKNIIARTSVYLEKKNFDFAIPVRYGVTRGWRRTIFYSNKYGCMNFLLPPFEEGRRITYDYLRLEVHRRSLLGMHLIYEIIHLVISTTP